VTDTADELARGRHMSTEEEGRNVRADRILAAVEPLLTTAQARVLDAGCGSGHIAQRIGRSRPGFTVTGMDIADSRIARDAHTFVQLNGSTMPFDDASFDAIISNHVLEHVGTESDQAAYLAELHRILANDGVLYLAVPNRYRLVEAHYSLPLLSWLPQKVADWLVRRTGKGTWYDITPPSRRTLWRHLEAAGFSIDDRTQAAARAALSRLPVVGSLGRRIPTIALRPLLAVVPTFIVIATPAPHA
jgi:SAM-dependent methyltransferase